MKIVLALDSSPQSEVIVKEVAKRPWPKNSVFHVLQVEDLMIMAPILNYYPPRVKEANEQARAFVAAAAAQLQARGLEATGHVIEGYPRTSIVDYAKQWQADFVVIGSHGFGDIARLFLGSVARSVVHHVHCSVEVVRSATRDGAGGSGGPMKLLLATDGSEFSAAAARSIAERPWPDGSEVKVVSVVDLVLPIADPWYAGGEVMERLRQESIKRAEEAVARAQTLLSGTRLKVTADVLSGSPQWRLVDEAKDWGADLVIVGSHGRRGITKLMLGSVSAAVAMHAHCSVDVIRDAALLAQATGTK